MHLPRSIKNSSIKHSRDITITTWNPLKIFGMENENPVTKLDLLELASRNSEKEEEKIGGFYMLAIFMG